MWRSEGQYLIICKQRSWSLSLFSWQLEDTLWAGLTDLQIKTPMGVTAENLAEKYQITREDCDNYAYQTQQRWKAGEQFPHI